MNLETIATGAVLAKTASLDESRRRIVAWAVFALLGLVLAGIGFVASMSLQADRNLFQSEGIATTGTVTDKSWGFRSNNRTYNLTVSYVVDGAGPLEQTVAVTPVVYDGLAKGGPVELLYARSKPERIQFAGSERTAEIIAFTWFIYIGAGLAALSVTGLLMTMAAGGGPAAPAAPVTRPGRGPTPSGAPPTGPRGFGKR